MASLVYRYIWAFCPNLSSIARYNLDQVQCEESQIDFTSLASCKDHAMQHSPDIPDSWAGPFLYIMEYNCQHDILESLTLID